MSKVLAASLLLVAGSCFLPFATAGELATAGYVEEVIVTAQKRAQRLQDVPISMSVLDEEALELRGFSRMDDIAFVVPNLAITNPADARTTQFTMRGITGQTFFPGTESAVGVFLDGVYVNNPIAQNFDLVDVERIEVLRGPQGTLYGKNTTAGAINLVSKRPDAERRAGVLAEYGNYGTHRIRAGVRGALADNVFGSLSAGWFERDGYQENSFLDRDLGTGDSWNVRGALRWVPNDRLEVNLTGDYFDEDRAPSAPDSSPEDREIALDLQPSETREVYGAAFTLEYALSDAVEVTSITAMRDYDHERVGDDDGTPLDAFVSPTTESTLQWSEELRLASTSDGPLQWVTGLYYLHSDLDGTSTPELDPDPLFQLNVGLTCTDLFTFQFLAQGLPPDVAAELASGFCAAGVGDNRIEQTSDTWAAFGEGTLALGSRVRLTLGLRASREVKDYRLQQLSPDVALFLAYPIDASFERDDTSLSPRLALQWTWNEHTELYATAAQGFKSGGFNTGPVGAASQLANTQFDEESLWNYEAGLKTALLDGRLRLDMAVFSIAYDDLQVFRFEEIAAGVFSSRITNAGAASSTGFEADVTWAASDRLSIIAGIGYADAEYDDFENCGVTNTIPTTALDCTGNKLTNAPDWTANVNALFRWPLVASRGIELLVNAEWAYRGEVYYDVFNNDDAKQEGFSLFNGSIGVGDSGGRWSAVLFGNNLGDEEYITIAVQGFANQRLRELGAPRTYGLRVNVNF